MRADYKTWLAAEGYAETTQSAQQHRLRQVEAAYGDIEQHLANGTLDAIIEELVYSSSDERDNKPNTSKLTFTGNIRNRLASHRDAIRRYVRFLNDVDDDLMQKTEIDDTSKFTGPSSTNDAPQRLALERDMQAALRQSIHSLAANLTIIDDGIERSVDSGSIDILCEDDAGSAVVIELKAGKSDSRVVAQILGYMGDLIAEDETRDVRGIIVAHEFDRRTLAAVRAVPTLQLFSYHVNFTFKEKD